MKSKQFVSLIPARKNSKGLRNKNLHPLNGKPLIHGWVDKVLQNTADVVYNYNQTDVCGFVFTDISRDGMMNGIDIEKVSGHLSMSSDTPS